MAGDVDEYLASSLDCDRGVFMVDLFLPCVERGVALYIGHEDDCMDWR